MERYQAHVARCPPCHLEKPYGEDSTDQETIENRTLLPYTDASSIVHIARNSRMGKGDVMKHYERGTEELIEQFLHDSKRPFSRGVTHSDTVRDELGDFFLLLGTQSKRRPTREMSLAYKVLLFEGEDSDDGINEALPDLIPLLSKQDIAHARFIRSLLGAVYLGLIPQMVGSKWVGHDITKLVEEFSGNLSPEAISTLESNASLCLLASEQLSKSKDEEKRIEAEEAQLLSTKKSGVYVFSYPHYIKYPQIHSDNAGKTPDRYLMKIGYSDTDMVERINSETNATGIPEHRVILRLYSSPSMSGRELETMFHEFLDLAGHGGSKRTSQERVLGGTEWFATNLDLLDMIANNSSLEIVIPDEEYMT